MTNERKLPELWQWAEYFCPWCYIAAVRLRKIMPEYAGRVRLRERAFPLEVYGSGAPIRSDIIAEMWLAALQEPAAEFAPFPDRGWPSTTIPAFEAAWIARQQSDELGHEIDFQIRKAFFADGRNIGRADVIAEIAKECGLDMKHFLGLFETQEAEFAVLEEGKLGRDQFRVRGVPTIMAENGKKFRHPIAYADILEGKVYSVGELPCCGESCYQLTRDIFETVSERVANSE
jgi:predicted DsbA family dithiol-disulfide isomerase